MSCWMPAAAGQLEGGQRWRAGWHAGRHSAPGLGGQFVGTGRTGQRARTCRPPGCAICDTTATMLHHASNTLRSVFNHCAGGVRAAERGDARPLGNAHAAGTGGQGGMFGRMACLAGPHVCSTAFALPCCMRVVHAPFPSQQSYDCMPASLLAMACTARSARATARCCSMACLQHGTPPHTACTSASCICALPQLELGRNTRGPAAAGCWLPSFLCRRCIPPSHCIADALGAGRDAR